MKMYNTESKLNSVCETLVSRSTSTFFSQFPSFFSLSLSFLFKKKRLRVRITIKQGDDGFDDGIWHLRRSSRMKMQESYFVRATETFIMTVFRDEPAKVSRTDSLINTSLDIHARRYRRSSSNLRLTTGRFETELRIKAAKANIGNVEREPIGSVPGNFPDRVGKKVTSRGEWNFLYVYQKKRKFARDLFPLLKCSRDLEGVW